MLGIIAALVTAAVNWHYKRQQARIEREVADASRTIFTTRLH